MVVMDQFTRRIIGFAVSAGDLDGPAICRMFSEAIATTSALPRNLSSDHDPLFEFHRWKANLRILDVTEVKTVPYVPLTSVRRATDRDDTARVSRFRAFLDDSRS
jgi:transposase InsO family protein